MWNNNEISKARAIIDAQEKQKALNAYNAEKAQLDAKYNNGGLGGFLGSIIGGIGKGIGDVGRGVYDLIGSGVASTKDLIEGKAGTQENLQAFKKDLYKTDDIKDAYAKSAGTALNAATTLATTALPMAGVGKLGGVAANTAAGSIGGVADELQQQGANASLESAANRAISGAAGGLIGGKPLKYVAPREYFAEYEGMKVYQYTIIGNTIHFHLPDEFNCDQNDDVPDNYYTMKIYYLAKPMKLSNPTDVPLIPSEYGEILIYGALARAERRRGNYDFAQIYDNQKAELITNMAMRYGPRQFDGGNRMKAPFNIRINEV